AASLYAGADGFDPGAWGKGAAAGTDRRLHAPAERDPAGLRLQSALPAGRAQMPPRKAGAFHGRGREGGLLAIGRRHGMSAGIKDRAAAPALKVRGLCKSFDVSAPWLNRVIERRERQILRAVDDIDFDVPRGGCLSL